MKTYKKFAQITIIFLLLAAVIFAIYYFSGDIFKVKKETKLVDMSLPAETQDLIIGVEAIKLLKANGIDTLLITGWVVKQSAREKKRDVYLVLKSNMSTLILGIGNADIIRPDVNQYFHWDTGINNYGFEIRFPLSLLKENAYQVGFVLEDKTGKYFTMSSKSLNIANGTVTLNDFRSEPDSVVKSDQISLTLKVPTGKIQNNFEMVNMSGNDLAISGWGFLQGMNSESMKSYILLKKDEKVTVFSVRVQIRKDVTSFFKELRLNLDSSGFTAQIPAGNLEKGSYRLGLYIEKGNQTGIIYSDKYVDIGK